MASLYKRGRKKKGNWLISWHDHAGARREKSSRTTDKAAAQRIANKIEADVALRREGVINPEQEQLTVEWNRPVGQHIEEYREKLQAAGDSAKHVKSTITFIEKIVEFTGAVTASEINETGVNRYTAHLFEKLNRAPRTVNAHLTAMKGFMRWLESNDKIKRNTLAGLRKPDPAKDRRLQRRMMLPEEWRVMSSSLSGDSFNMTADERRLLYLTALQTGFRSNEMRSLTCGSVYLEAEKPYITAKSKSTKNSEDARQYILDSLAEELRPIISGKPASDGLFSMPHETCVAKMMRRDLKNARDKWLEGSLDDEEREQRQRGDFLNAVDHSDLRLDFHALRHTCGAWLSKAGVHIKIVQTVMRHSNISLTMDIYGHLFPGEVANAVGNLKCFLDVPVLNVEPQQI
jgi:integrase